MHLPQHTPMNLTDMTKAELLELAESLTPDHPELGDLSQGDLKAEIVAALSAALAQDETDDPSADDAFQVSAESATVTDDVTPNEAEPETDPAPRKLRREAPLGGAPGRQDPSAPFLGVVPVSGRVFRG